MKKMIMLAFFVSLSFGHFQTVMVDKSVIEDKKDKTLHVRYEFTHPFEQSLMNMQKPKEAGVFIDGKKVSLLNKLTPKKVGEFQTWEALHVVDEIGVYQFYVDPQPYFEPSEGKFIRHQTKTVVDAYGAGEGWDDPIGLEAEIIPLSRPYSLYAGGIFSGQVFHNGKPAKNVEVEYELYNTKALKSPNNMYTTQVTKTDSNGVFHVGLPTDGWWGFSALLEDDMSIKKDGKEYPVELGAVIWIKVDAYK